MIFVVVGIGLRSRSGSQWIHRTFKEFKAASECKNELNSICAKENLDAIYVVQAFLAE